MACLFPRRFKSNVPVKLRTGTIIQGGVRSEIVLDPFNIFRGAKLLHQSPFWRDVRGM